MQRGFSLGRYRLRVAFAKIVLVALICATGTISAYAVDYTNPPETTGASVIMIDAESGQVLYEKNADEVRAPASLTKIMTALVVFDTHLPMKTLVTIDEETENVGEVQIELVAGENISLGDLMAAMLIYSANDAAMGIAKAVAPTAEMFEDMMNAKAVALGMTNTHFNNPNGLPITDHYSTARDLSILTQAALKYDDFRLYIGMSDYRIAATNLSEEREFKARNLLVRDSGATIMVYGERRPVYYDGAFGVKTGFTNEAGNCLIGAAERDGMTVITVVLGSPPPGHQYEDTVSLFEWAFAEFTKCDIFSERTVGRKIIVERGRAETVVVVPESTLSLVIKRKQTEDLTYVYDLPESIKAPVSQGQKLGSVKAMSGTEVIAETTLIAREEVLKPLTIFERLSFGNKTAEQVLKIVVIVLFAIIVAIALLIIRKSIIMHKRRKRRRHNGRRSGKSELHEVKDFGKVTRKG